jgi:two-component system, response regulator PdtaR
VLHGEIPGVISGKRKLDARDSAPPRILIVEDEALIAMECEFILTDAEYDVVGIAADEPRALLLAEREQPDLVLMDIRLARGGNGLDVAASIIERWGIRSIFVSAHGDQATRERAAGANPAGWVVKPYTANALLKAIGLALSQETAHA